MIRFVIQIKIEDRILVFRRVFLLLFCLDFILNCETICMELLSDGRVKGRLF